MNRFSPSGWPGRIRVLAAAGFCGALSAGAACSGSNSSSPSAQATGPDASLSDAGVHDATAPKVAAPMDANVPDVQADAETTGCTVGDAGESTELRCTGLYSDFATLTVASDVQPFDPGLHLWSDGAVKSRWIYLPADPAGDGGTRLPIDTSNMNEWTFPVGTKFWKEFVLGGKRVETRLLWKQDATTWYRTTYLWSPDGSSATELTLGEPDADGHGYEVPTQVECRTCHMGRVDDVLGFEAVDLASPDASPSLQDIAARGWLTKVPDAGTTIPGNPADVAALGYLHANCGIACHNSGRGAAEQTGLFMRLEVGAMQNVQATGTWQTGVDQPSFFTPPDGTTKLLVFAPGDAGASCVYYRMSHRAGVDGVGAGVQMPPIDSHKVDEAGISTIEAWIDQLPGELDSGHD